MSTPCIFMVLAVLGWVLPMHAASPVRIADLVSEALANNPEILAAQKVYEAARQRRARESSMPDPVLSVGYTSNGGPLPGQQLGSNPTSNIGFSVAQEIPYPGKLQLRGQIAAKDAEAEFWQYQAVQLAVRSRVVQAAHRLHHTYAAVGIEEHAKAVLSDMLRVSEARYVAGKAAQQDIFKTQTQLSMMETRIIKMLQDRAMAEAELNSLLNRKPGNAVGEPVSEEVPHPALSVDEILVRALATSPELNRRLKMVARSELGVNLARKDFHPDYTVSAGYYNQGGMSPMYQVRVDVPIRLHAESRQRPALNEQVDLLSESRRNYEAAQQSLQFRVRSAWAELETASRLAKLYTDTVLPQSRLTVESSLTAYQTGNADLVSVLSNLATEIDVEEQFHEQELNYALAIARIEEMTGVEISSGRDK